MIRMSGSDCGPMLVRVVDFKILYYLVIGGLAVQTLHNRGTYLYARAVVCVINYISRIRLK